MFQTPVEPVALVSHAAGRERNKHSGHRLLVSSCMHLIRDKSSPIFLP